MLWCLADAALENEDFARARELWERGASLGDPACWVGLGFMFDTGQGVEVDKEKALRCYRAAWRQRNASAANNIAGLYRQMGNRRAMFRWLRRAAEHGDDGANLDLSRCYLNGVGVRRSLDEAVRCLARVMAGGCVSEAERDEARELLKGLRPRGL